MAEKLQVEQIRPQNVLFLIFGRYPVGLIQNLALQLEDFGVFKRFPIVFGEILNLASLLTKFLTF